MSNTDNTLTRVMEKQGDAICKTHEKSDLRFVGEDNICLTIRFICRSGRMGAHHICAVNLPDVKNRFGRATQGLEGKNAILSDTRQIIPHCPANVQRTPRLRADASMAGEDSMFHVQRIELKITKSIVLNTIHLKSLTQQSNYRSGIDRIKSSKLFDKELA